MTETPKNPKLSEEQVDRLLAAFYKSEVPDQLDVPPSAWPELSGGRSPVVAKSGSEKRHQQPQSRRGIVVAIASLAACLMLLGVSDFGPNGSRNTTESPVTAERQVDAPSEGLMTVSEKPGAAQDDTLNDNGLKLEELEDIRLESESAEEKKKKGEEPPK